MIEIDPIIFELSNGIRVCYLKTDAFVAHLGVMIQAGSRYEQKNEEGLAHFLEHCIFKGTTKRKAVDIFSDLDSVGGELNAYTTKEEICVHASFRKNHFSIAAELLSDIVQNASFPEDEIEKEKEVVLDEIISYLDSPVERIYDDFEALIFKGHSLGYNTLGTKETVNSFSRDNLLDYMQRYFTPSNMVISFVGGVDLNVLKKELEECFGDMPQKKFELFNAVLPPFEPFKLKELKSNYQTHTVIGGRAPSYNDPDRKAMTLLTNVLGGPALNSRLTLSIREKYGYAYNVEANFTTYFDAGFWSVYMGTDKKYLKKAINLIYKEIELIRKVELSSRELEQAKEQLKGHIALSLDNNLELMLSLARSILIHNKIDSLGEVYQKIDSISLPELTEVARKYLSEDNFAELIYEF